MTSKFKSALLVLSLLLMAVGVASAAPDEIPVSSITIAVVDATGATTALVPVTAQSVGAPGARGFDLWINYDHANLSSAWRRRKLVPIWQLWAVALDLEKRLMTDLKS